jgi:hypothetical protein
MIFPISELHHPTLAAAPPIHYKPSSTGLEFILPTTGSLETFPEESHLKLESVTLKESQ